MKPRDPIWAEWIDEGASSSGKRFASCQHCKLCLQVNAPRMKQHIVVHCRRASEEIKDRYRELVRNQSIATPKQKAEMSSKLLVPSASDFRQPESEILSSAAESVRSDVEHSSDIEDGESDFLCHVCAATFTQILDLRRHMMVEHQISTDDFCSPAAEERARLQTHLCSKCSATYKEPRALQEHMKRVHNMVLPGMRRNRMMSVWRHFTEEDGPDEDLRYVRCHYCHVLIWRRRDGRYHRVHLFRDCKSCPQDVRLHFSKNLAEKQGIYKRSIRSSLWRVGEPLVRDISSQRDLEVEREDLPTQRNMNEEDAELQNNLLHDSSAESEEESTVSEDGMREKNACNSLESCQNQRFSDAMSRALDNSQSFPNTPNGESVQNGNGAMRSIGLMSESDRSTADLLIARAVRSCGMPLWVFQTPDWRRFYQFISPGWSPDVARIQTIIKQWEGLKS